MRLAIDEVPVSSEALAANGLDFDSWRQQARALLQRRVPPAQAPWQGDCRVPDLFAEPESWRDVPPLAADVQINRAFIVRAERVACHAHPGKWQLLYALAWRLVFEDPRLLDNPTDATVVRFNRMYKTVSRERHKMTAFVRFKSLTQMRARAAGVPVASAADASAAHTRSAREPEHFVAWFEPEHPIVALTAPFFVKRFANMNWSILTPWRCAHWLDGVLSFGEGVVCPNLEADASEALWLNYYTHIFNPARLKLKAMQAEMPKRYWRNLPEASLIASLTGTSTRRVEQMIEAAGKGDTDRLRNARAVRAWRQARERESRELT